MTNRARIKKDSKKPRSLLPSPIVSDISSPTEKSRAPRFKLYKENTLEPEEKNFEKFTNKMQETAGTKEIDFFLTLIAQVCNISAVAQNDPVKAANFSSAFLHGLEPRDQTEGILFAQMAGTHNLIMEFMRRAIYPEQNLDAGEKYTYRACKLMNLFLRQIETLEKYRGKSTQQKVIVEHVHVEEGGKAIVGNVERPAGGGGR